MGKDLSKVNCIFHFCDGGSCRKAGSEQVVREARAYLKNAGLSKSTHTIKTRCNGRCEDAPTWIVYPGNFWYKNLDPAKGVEIIQSHTMEEKPLTESLLFQPGWEEVRSEKERLQETAGFKWVTDPALGEIMLAKMGSSEQVLYPLLKFLFKKYDQVEIIQPGKDPLQLSCAPLVEYSDTFDIWVKGQGLFILFAIAPLPAEAPPALVERKVGIVELIVLPGDPAKKNSKGNETLRYAQKKGLRLRSRKGKELLQIWFKEKEGFIWNHVLENYLELKPTETLIKEYEQN